MKTFNQRLLQNHLARLDAGELHEVALSLVEKMEAQDIGNRVFRDGDAAQFEFVSIILCEALSQLSVITSD